MTAHVSKNTGNNEWYTPEQYIGSARRVMGSIDTDPASNTIAQAYIKARVYWTKENNGLDRLWSGNVWMNPPYSASLIGKFCCQLVFSSRLGMVNQFVTLTNNATDTGWFQTLASVSTALCFPQSRIRFISPEGKKSNPLQGQVFCYYGNNTDAFIDEFSQYGICCYVRA